MQAMLRMAFRLGADLGTAFRHVNDQLAATLPEDRFITAFIGVLDPHSHRFEFHSGGQGPILHLSAATGTCTAHRPTSFPLGAMPLVKLRPSVTLEMHPGDLVLLLTDGVYEYEDTSGTAYGEGRVEAIARSHGTRSMAQLAERLLADVTTFAGGAPQLDDVTHGAGRARAGPCRPALRPQLRGASRSWSRSRPGSSPASGSTSACCPRSTSPSRSSSPTW